MQTDSPGGQCFQPVLVPPVRGAGETRTAWKDCPPIALRLRSDGAGCIPAAGADASRTLGAGEERGSGIEDDAEGGEIEAALRRAEQAGEAEHADKGESRTEKLADKEQGSTAKEAGGEVVARAAAAHRAQVAAGRARQRHASAISANLERGARRFTTKP